VATILSKVLSGKWGAALKDTGKYVEDHPLAAAMVIGLGGYALAGGFAAAAPTLAAGTTVAGAGSATVASTFPMAGVAQTAGAAGAKSGMANFLFGSPAKQFMIGTGINVLGQYLAAKGASEDAARMEAEGREFSREMFEKQQAAQKVSFVPQTRGVLASARREPEPIVASPSQALRMRKSGAL